MRQKITISNGRFRLEAEQRLAACRDSFRRQ